MNKPVFKTTSRKPDVANFTVEFAAGDHVFREGELGMEMYIVHEGTIEILKDTGEESQVLATLEKGDFFGEMAILEDLPRTASARAVTAAKLLMINGSTFDQMLRTNPEIAVRMMRKLSRRLCETDRLLHVALGSPGPAPIVEMPSQQEPKAEAEAEATPQRLLHEKSGMEFSLASGPETTIGRRDPVTGINPDVDLTPVDTQRSISRRHAKIYRRGGKFFLAEEIGTMNGTFRGGQRLETGVPVEISPGDHLRFGLVELDFVGE
ncbi:MAG TPA: cyclic nucleotide-binding domain-containing protein [Thermoanaerobaculia bacterium]|nr:cyclic nucleotide-binding domain-containing protein [Thermoanaerobaculia bacterium]